MTFKPVLLKCTLVQALILDREENETPLCKAKFVLSPWKLQKIVCNIHRNQWKLIFLMICMLLLHLVRLQCTNPIALQTLIFDEVMKQDFTRLDQILRVEKQKQASPLVCFLSDSGVLARLVRLKCMNRTEMCVASICSICQLTDRSVAHPGNTNLRGRLSTVDLLTTTCLVLATLHQ